MIVESTNPGIQPLLRALGMPDNCTKFVLVAEVGQVLKVRATFYPDVDSAVAITKTYYLVERG